ncbi:non-histone chromosomal protein HMG-14 isoform X1 [Symphalangus syndactylus]
MFEPKSPRRGGARYQWPEGAQVSRRIVGGGPAVTWRASANQRADRTLQLGFKQTTVRPERHWDPAPFAWVWGPARRRKGVGAAGRGRGAGSSDGPPHLFRARAEPRSQWAGAGAGGGPAGGEGEPAAGDAGGAGGGLPIRFHPVLPPPPLWVSAARAAGGVAAARQPSFAKALGAPRPAGTRHAPSPPPGCPRGRSVPPKALPRKSPRGDRRGCQLNLLQKWKRSRKRQQRRKFCFCDRFKNKASRKDKSSDKKVQTKGKRGAKGKQAEVANQETKEDLPAENGETKTEESPASDEAGEKEAKSD